MRIIQTIKELINYTKNIQNQTIGFVPTMGSLHKGHISLIKNARMQNDIVIVSIFINPTQFLANEDLSQYPSKDDADIKICEFANVDILFMPNSNEMYKEDEISIHAPKNRGYILEGLKRPGHFDGVLQIVLKLFNLTKPTNAYFGKKDAQQLVLIEQMTKNLYLNINIVACEIVRDENGLALSSRNIYLNNEEEKQALLLSKSLREATKLILNNEFNCDLIINHMKQILKDQSIEYINIVSRDFKSLEICEINNTIILASIKLRKTRLLDNIWI